MNKKTKYLVSYLSNLWGTKKPVAKLFRTNSGYYLYDTGTSKVLRCKFHVYELLNLLFSEEISTAISSFKAEHGEKIFEDVSADIIKAIDTEGILSSMGATRFGSGDHYANIEELVKSSLGMITLEITENCNLRCGYCIYNSYNENAREHSKTEMCIEVALKGIDYLKKNSHKKDRVAITFYGGEPLLRFKFIQRCVEYARSTIKEKKIDYSITTNGTLLTPEIARFFRKHNFSVVVSIDGPKEIHDSFRKDTKGKGSFQKAIQGLKTLIDIYCQDASEKISLSMVYTPPYSRKRLDRIASLWDELPWLPADLNVNMTYPSTGTFPYEHFSKDELNEDVDMRMWGAEKFKKKYSGVEKGHPISNSQEELKLAAFMQRKIFHSPEDRYFLNGCCVPGVRKLFIASDGTFRVCEKISFNAPTIGNVFTGIDLHIIKSIYIDSYEKLSLPACSRCWAIRLCHVCYIYAFEDKNLSLRRKSVGCRAELDAKERLLNLFSVLTENDLSGLDYLYSYKLQ
jgi:uncharacterized protein